MKERQFTTQELAIVQALASDPTVSSARLAHILEEKAGREFQLRTLKRLIQEAGIDWVEPASKRGRRKKVLTPEQLAELTRMAADPRVTLRDAAAQIGTSGPVLCRLMKAQGIPWVSHRAPRDPEREPTRPVSAPRKAVKAGQGIQVKPEDATRKRVPRVSVPSFSMHPETRMGHAGYAYHCPALSLSGWKPGSDRNAVRAAIRDELAFPVSRQSADNPNTHSAAPMAAA